MGSKPATSILPKYATNNTCYIVLYHVLKKPATPRGFVFCKISHSFLLGLTETSHTLVVIRLCVPDLLTDEIFIFETSYLLGLTETSHTLVMVRLCMPDLVTTCQTSHLLDYLGLRKFLDSARTLLATPEIVYIMGSICERTERASEQASKANK